MPKRKRLSSVKSCASNKSPRKRNLNASTEENDNSTLDQDDDNKLKELVRNIVFTFDVDDNEVRCQLDTCDELACLSAGEESENENKKPLEADGNSHNNLLEASSCSSPLKRASPLSPTLFDNVLQHRKPTAAQTVQTDSLSNGTPNQVPKTEDEQESITTRGSRSSRRKRIIRESPKEKIVVVEDTTSTVPLSNDEKLKFKQKSSKEITTSQKPLESSDKINLPEANFRIVDDYKLEEMPVPGPHYRIYVGKSKEELCRAVIYELDEVDICWLDVFNRTTAEDYFNLLRIVEYHEMELLLDRFEKECYYALQNAGMGQPGESDEDAVCCICLDGTSDDSNLILFCDMCNIAVHQDCFGVPFVPEGTWLCRRCSIIPHGVVECIFCPNKDGAFKQTVDGRWSHVLCALWIPEVRFSNPSILEPVDDIEDIPPARWKLICFLCKKKGVGACIQCHLRSCVTAFHVTCAQQAGLSLQLAECGRVRMKASCDKHTSDREKEILKQKVETVYKILGEKRASESQTQFPSIPLDRINAIAELITIPLPLKKIFMRRLLTYWKQKRMSRGGAALLRNLESVWIEGLKEPLSPLPLENPVDDPVSVLETQKKLLLRYQASLTIVKDYCELVLKHSEMKNEDLKEKHRIDVARLEQFHLHGMDVYLDVLDKLAAKDKHDTFAEPVTDEDAPDYSTTIKNPMDLTTMREKTMQLQYTTIDDLESDFNLMINNCMTYNKKSTPFYKDAVKLKEYANQVFEDARLVLEQRSLETNALAEKDWDVLDNYDNDDDQLAEPTDSKYLVNNSLQGVLINILEELTCCDKNGTFAQPVDVNEVPDYFDVIEKPMDFSAMRNKINTNQYSCIEDLEIDFSLMINNCLQYNKENSEFYKKGEELNVMGKEILKVAKQKQYTTVIKIENNNYKTETDSSTEIECEGTNSAKMSEAELIVDVLEKLIKTDVEDIFAEPVTDEDAPDYSTMIKTPMDFSLMQEKLKASMYSTLEDLEKDFSVMIDNCKRYNSSGTMHFNYAVKIKRTGSSIFNAARKKIAAPTKVTKM